MKQTTFASAAWDKKGKVTRRERFLAEMDAVIPWARLLALIEPHYPKAGNGTQPMPLERMLRIYFMQNWFNLSDPGAEDALYDSESMRSFAGIELVEDAIADESTILRFRHLLEEHKLTEAIFAEVRSLLEQKRLLLKSGTIVDATIIAAPPSTKNAQEARDPEMKQTRKGKQWHFGMKAHVGTDPRGIVHSLATTDAAAADITQMHKLLHGEESEVFGDQAYWCEAHRQSAAARGIRYRINRRGTSTKPLTEHQLYINQVRSKARARDEHAFHVVKRLWGFAKVRYRGLAKNTARLFTAFALANLPIVDELQCMRPLIYSMCAGAQTRVLRWSEQQVRHAHHVVADHAQLGEPADLGSAAQLRSAQQSILLAPAEALLDALAKALTESVARVARGARIDRRAARC